MPYKSSDPVLMKASPEGATAQGFKPADQCQSVGIISNQYNESNTARSAGKVINNHVSTCRAAIRRQKDGGEVAMEFMPGFTGGSIFRVKDNSMEPTYDLGDRLVCTRVESITRLWSGCCAIIRINKHFMLKKVHQVDGHILLVSDSEEFPVKKIDPTEVEEVWQVDKMLSVKLLEDYVPRDSLARLQRSGIKRDQHEVEQKLIALMRK